MLEIVRAAENLVPDFVPISPKSPKDDGKDSLHKKTTVMMSKHTLEQPQIQVSISYNLKISCIVIILSKYLFYFFVYNYYWFYRY